MFTQEDDLPDHLAFLAMQHKLERVATYRQLQALSSALNNLTAGRLTLSDFIPAGVTLRPVEEGEVRLLRLEGGLSSTGHDLAHDHIL